MTEFNLSEELKKAGLNVAEDAAKSAVKAVLKVLPAYALQSENKMDDLLIPILGVIEAPLMELIDKIDGEKG